MSHKSLMLGLPAAILLGGGALAFGLLPGVRDWVDQSIPWLGINGPKLSSSNQSVDAAIESRRDSAPEQPIASDMVSQGSDFGMRRDIGMEKKDHLDAPAKLPTGSEVTFAGGGQLIGNDNPSLNTNAWTTGNNDVRLAQARNLETVPQSGQYVPSRGKGTVSLERAQVKFFEVNSVAAQAEGRIDKLNVDEGSMIEAGAPMVEIDSRLVLKEIRVAERELDAARLKAKDNSNVKFSKAAKEVAEAEVEISTRLQSQGAEGFTEGMKKRLELKKAGFQVEVAEIEKARDTADADVKEAKLEAAKVQLELRTILAPRTGVITEVVKRQYDWVRAGEVILKLTSLSKLRIKGTVVVSDSPHLLENAPAKVTITIAPELKGETIDGVVSYVSPQTALEANRYDVHVDVENRLTADGHYLFREGMQATVEITPKSR
jgi:multidrug efflux pump subunit AcrA (membrane-fusion protein)